jgi:putative transposase
MRDILVLFVHLIVTLIRLAKPGGLRAVVAESVLIRHQLQIVHRGRKRAPNLRACDRIITGLCTLLMRPARILRSAIVLKPSTLLNFHAAIVKRKYRLLFSPKRGRRPGPKGPSSELIAAVVEMNGEIRRGAVGESHSRSRSLSASTSIKTRCAGFSAGIIGSNPDREVRPG